MPKEWIADEIQYMLLQLRKLDRLDRDVLLDKVADKLFFSNRIFDLNGVPVVLDKPRLLLGTVYGIVKPESGKTFRIALTDEYGIVTSVIDFQTDYFYDPKMVKKVFLIADKISSIKALERYEYFREEESLLRDIELIYKMIGERVLKENEYQKMMRVKEKWQGKAIPKEISETLDYKKFANIVKNAPMMSANVGSWKTTNTLDPETAETVTLGTIEEEAKEAAKKSLDGIKYKFEEIREEVLSAINIDMKQKAAANTGLSAEEMAEAIRIFKERKQRSKVISKKANAERDLLI